MSELVITINYTFPSKPFELVERNAHCGGTDYETICRLNERHTRMLMASGINYLYGEIKWENFYKKIELRNIEIEEQRLAKVKRVLLNPDGTKNE